MTNIVKAIKRRQHPKVAPVVILSVAIKQSGQLPLPQIPVGCWQLSVRNVMAQMDALETELNPWHMKAVEK